MLTPPDHLVAERVTLDLGDRAVELVDLGRGHTGNDLVVVVPAAGVVFAGDLLEESAPPAFGTTASRSSGRPRPVQWWPKEEAVYVPGHGDVMAISSSERTECETWRRWRR